MMATDRRQSPSQTACALADCEASFFTRVRSSGTRAEARALLLTALAAEAATLGEEAKPTAKTRARLVLVEQRLREGAGDEDDDDEADAAGGGDRPRPGCRPRSGHDRRRRPHALASILA